MKNRVLLCIVLYKVKLLQSKTYLSFVQSNYVRLFVYDNSPEKQTINRPNTIYTHDPSNRGLSVAYNAAAKYAKENGYKWLLLLDQDTDFSNISIDDYAQAISDYPDVKLFAPKVNCGAKFMSPAKVWNKMMFLQDIVPTGQISLSKYSLINSGICVNVDAMIECGGYNEKVFLDYSDFEFLERLKKLYPIAFVIDKEISQNLSVLSDDKSTTINRYSLFCRSVKHCERQKASDTFWFFVLVFKRGLSICVKKKTLKPIKIFITEYL